MWSQLDLVQGYSAINLIELHGHSDFMYVHNYIMFLSHWPAMLLRLHGVRKNCKYTVDTPHALRNFVCAVVSPNVHHKMLNMLKKLPCDRRANHTQKVRGKDAVQTPTCVGCAQPVCSSYANDRHTCAINWACECSALPRAQKNCATAFAHIQGVQLAIVKYIPWASADFNAH